MAKRVLCVVCFAYAGMVGCSGKSQSAPTAGVDAGDAGAPARFSCPTDAATNMTGVPPEGDSGTCAPGNWLNSGLSCGPYSGDPTPHCTPTGDALCYRLCATSDDCPDPCAHACQGMPFFSGGDTPHGEVPVCQALEVAAFPAPCELTLRTCWTDCKHAGLTADCAMSCWAAANECAYQACQAAHDKCSEQCGAALTPADVLACNDACTAEQTKCRGPLR